MVTTALGYTPWYSGDHPTTISGYGITDIPTYSGTNFILNQNSSAQSARMWISGAAKIDGGLALTNRYHNSTNGSIIYNSGSGAGFIFAETAPSVYDFGSGSYGSNLTPTLSLNISTREANFYSTVNSTGFLLNGNNLTSSLAINYIPKWIGSRFVNATAGTDYQLPITLTTNGTSGAATFSGNVLNVPNYVSTGTGGEFTSTFTNVSNTKLSTSTLATYTNINGVINASVFGAVTSTSVGKCTFRVSVPRTIRSGRCAVISGVELGKTTSANIFIEGTGSTYVDISFIASTPSSILVFNLITMGY